MFFKASGDVKISSLYSSIIIFYFHNHLSLPLITPPRSRHIIIVVSVFKPKYRNVSTAVATPGTDR